MPIRRIIFVVFEDFQLLDMSGPAAVFHAASDFSSEQRYEIIITSPEGGPVRSSCGVVVASDALSTISVETQDTVLTVGGTVAGALSEETDLRQPMRFRSFAG